jgi:hypothetical protein
LPRATAGLFIAEEKVCIDVFSRKVVIGIDPLDLDSFPVVIFFIHVAKAVELFTGGTFEALLHLTVTFTVLCLVVTVAHLCGIFPAIA